jgi:chaperonin GroEL
MSDLPKREIRDLYFGDDVRAIIASGNKKLRDAVGATYGPKGHNVSIGMPFGDPILTRDGVTVAKRIVLPDRAEDQAIAPQRQASEQTNREAGDATSLTVVLGTYEYDGGNRRISGGEDPMYLAKIIKEDAQKVVEFIKSKSESSEGHLAEVATVSSGDPAIGSLIADTLLEIGTSGGVTIREQNYPTIDVEKVGGYYFDKGFFALNQAIDIVKPIIFVTQKQLSAHGDIIPLLSRVINGDNKNLIIVGDVRINSDAMNTLLLNVSQNKLTALVVPPPAFNDEGLLFMQDIALYVGSKLFVNGDDINLVKTTNDYFGIAERVQVGPNKAIIFNGNGVQEDIDARAAEIKDAIDKEKSSHRKDTLEQRYAKLTGKSAIINVGGSTQTEMEELRYRVEDAIEATRGAMFEGVLPGGNTVLIRALDLDISPLFKDAIKDTFRKLMNNAGEPADYRLEQVRHAKEGWGFNLRNMTEEPVDLREQGIFDATRSIMSAVRNASSAAADQLTTGVLAVPRDETNE